MTLIAEEKGSVAWHGDTGHNAFGIIMNLIDEQMKKEGKAEQVCFSIVVQDAHSTYFSGGQELCGTCAREVGWLDVLEDY